MKTLLALIACMALLSSSAGARQASETCEPSHHQFPQELVQIPDGYAAPAERQGTLENLYYETWESFSCGEAMAQMARDAGYEWNDFFIFAASGTDDFACSSFRDQIEAMADAPGGMFRTADNEAEGNLCYLEQPGGTHSGEYAMLYFYNGILWLWEQ